MTIHVSFTKLNILFGLFQLFLLSTESSAFTGISWRGRNSIILSSTQKDEANLNRREAIINVATVTSTLTSGVAIANADAGGTAAKRMGPPLFTTVKQLETANYMGQVGKPIYQPNVSGDPEKHLPKIKIDGTNIEVSVPHVMTEEHFIQYMWLKDTKINEVVLVKEFAPGAEAGNPILKAKVPSGVELQPYLFCNLHGLWKGEPFVVS